MPLKILNQIDDAIAAAYNPEDDFRNHFGISGIGKSCQRANWFSYRWVTLPHHSPQLLRIFKTGHFEEPRFTSMLEAAGYKVLTINPDSITPTNPEGDQFRFNDKVVPVIAGSIDGIALDLLQNGKKCGLEYKTMKAESFRELCKKAVQEFRPMHYSQMQGYMFTSKGTKWELDAFLYLVKNKNNDELYSEFVLPDGGRQQIDIELARQTVRSEVPPDRISASEDWYECGFCDHLPVCHRKAPLEHKNCRNCTHGRPSLADAESWRCLRFDMELNRKDQLLGCNFHSGREF